MNRLTHLSSATLLAAPEPTGDASSLHPNRDGMHRYMGPADAFPCCGGRGWTYAAKPGTENDEIPDVYEAYCSCAAGQRRREVDE